jgi:hypothetical protein
MPVEPGASADLPTNEDGDIDWVMVASVQSFPASDAPAYPASAGRASHVADERETDARHHATPRSRWRAGPP